MLTHTCIILWYFVHICDYINLMNDLYRITTIASSYRRCRLLLRLTTKYREDNFQYQEISVNLSKSTDRSTGGMMFPYHFNRKHSTAIRLSIHVYAYRDSVNALGRWLCNAK